MDAVFGDGRFGDEATRYLRRLRTARPAPAFRWFRAPASLSMTSVPSPVPDRPAVLLFSGGLDSTTLLALASAEGYAIHALTFRYGQRHAHEVEAARRLADRFSVRQHVVADIDLRMF